MSENLSAMDRLRSVDFGRPYVIVFGDAFVDRLIFYETVRESPEGGHPVVRKVREIVSEGGASAVRDACCRAGGMPKSISHVTEEKTRHVVDGRVAFRCDRRFSGCSMPYPRHYGPPRPISASRYVHRVIEEEYRKCDAIIVADYGKGFINENSFADVVKLSQRFSAPLLVDPARGRPIEFYRGATAIFPNRHEANQPGEPQHRWMTTAMRELNLEACVVKLDREGYVARFRGDSRVFHGRSQCPPEELVDVSGAGDHFIAAAAVAKAKGASWIDAVIAGNHAAGEKCRHWGASSHYPALPSLVPHESPVS